MPKIHHLNCGTMCPLCDRLMNDRNGSWTQPGNLVCHCLVIETDDTLVLVDTGLGLRDIAEPARRLGGFYRRTFAPRLSRSETMHSQLQALGYDPADVGHIAVTHLDLDHAGGLADFPNAKVHVYKPELEQILKPGIRERIRFRQPQFEHNPDWVVHEEQGDEWFGFSSIRPIEGLNTDILLIPLIGHTRGHVGVAINDGGHWLLHCGDSFYHRGEIMGSPPPPKGLMAFEAVVQTLREPRLKNQARLKALAKNHSPEVDLFCAHDPVMLAELQTKAVA